MHKIFILRFVELRTANNLSKAEMSKILGVSVKTITKWECGKSMPKVNHLIKISKFFNVKCDYLLGLK